MDRDLANPHLPRFERAALLAACLLVPLGVSLLWPTLSVLRWPWQIPPFNARFIGVIYLAGWVGALTCYAVGRHSPALGYLRAAAVFTAVATLASAMDRKVFLAERPVAVAVWWLAYIGFCLVLAAGARHLGARPVGGRLPSPGQRRVYGLYALLTTAYGLALFLVPVAASSFWPWPVDAFHGRVYSGIFLSGTALLAGLRGEHRAADRTLAGLLQTVFGLGSLWGAWSVDRSLGGRVDWGSGGTWLWLAVFGGIAAAGLALMVQGLGRRDGPG